MCFWCKVYLFSVMINFCYVDIFLSKLFQSNCFFFCVKCSVSCGVCKRYFVKTSIACIDVSCVNACIANFNNKSTKAFVPRLCPSRTAFLRQFTTKARLRVYGV